MFLTFARNSLVRDMTFRANFIIECVTSLSWMAMNLGFYLLIFQFTHAIGMRRGWGKYEFFVFLATTLFVNSLVQAFFMPNCEEFSELIRTGDLDFALLKPIDTQFLISLQKIDWSSLSNFFFAVGLLVYSLAQLDVRARRRCSACSIRCTWLCGVAMLYSLMIALSATSVWLGRNQNLYDFWFYITNFSRYPMEIYEGPIGTPLRLVFTFVDSDAGGGERAGATAGQAARGAELAAGRSSPWWPPAASLWVSRLDLPPRHAQLPQRQ